MEIAARIAVSSVTFRDESLEHMLERVHGLGFRQLDLVSIPRYCPHFDPLLVDVGEEECVRVRTLVAGLGLQAVSITGYPANPLAHDLNGDDWVEGVDAYIRLGLHLGARHLILPPGTPAPPVDRWRGTAERAKWWLRDGARRAAQTPMRPALALQTNSLLRTPQQGTAMLRLIGEPKAGLAVDPAHLAAVGEDPAAAIRALGAAVAFVVLRDTDGTDFNLPPGRGTLDYPAILDALEAVRYTGPLVLAVDDITVPREVRADLLLRGWEYLSRLADQRKAA